MEASERADKSVAGFRAAAAISKLSGVSETLDVTLGAGIRSQWEQACEEEQIAKLDVIREQ